MGNAADEQPLPRFTGSVFAADFQVVRCRMRASTVIFVLLFLTARGPSISKNAIAHRSAGGCQLVIEGKFQNMVHSFSQLIFPGTSKITARIYVPSLYGSYSADKVRVTYEGESGEPWNVGNLSGEVLFQDEQVMVNLLQKRTETEPIKPILFNGKYVIPNRSDCT